MGLSHFPRAHDRAVASDWARDLLSRSDWVILDTETCGLYEMAHICEIAVIRPDGSEILNTRIRPAIPIPPEATAIHGIANEDVATAPHIHSVCGDLNTLLMNIKTIVTYNAEFDRQALELSIDAGQKDSPFLTWASQWRWECAMTWYAQWWGDWSMRHGRYAYRRLHGGHSALSDCRACLTRILEMAGQTLS